MGRTHIIGAGLAGLSTAVRLTQAGHDVRLYEAAGQAGGRCRSYHDKALGTLIDNGNHLIMSGNRSATAFLETIGARDTMIEPPRAVFPFVDVKNGARWSLRPNAGPLPWWVFAPSRRVPDTKLTDYFEGVNVALASRERTVADVLATDGPLYTRFWEPLVLAALNTTADDGAACLLWTVLSETFLKGEAACRPLIARDGLGPSFIDPALAYLAARGTTPDYARRLTHLDIHQGRVTTLHFHNGPETVEPDETVVLALPAARAGQILPDLDPPGDGGVIVNVHYRLDEPVADPAEAPFIGLINSPVHWVFTRGHIVSLTISAAGTLADGAAEALAPQLWPDTAMALGLGDRTYADARVIKEKRATFDQSPAGIAKRKGPDTAYTNLVLAGDWTNTGLPATIEGAIRSGERAAARLMS